MSRLNSFINQLCPDGVEYKALGEIATISRGGSFQKKHFVDSGVPCIHYGQIYTRYGLFAHEALTYISDEVAVKQRFAQPNDIVMAVTSENIEDVCKCVVWLGDTPVAVSGHSAIIHHTQNAKYLAYYFHSSMFFTQKRKIAQGTKVIEVSPDKLNRIIVPIPPLEVQAEIVRILDKFTELTTELATELADRKKQYEYYRNELFLSIACTNVFLLREIAETNIGLATSVTKHKTSRGVQLLHNSDIQQNRIVVKKHEYITDAFAEKNKKKILHKGDIITVHTGDVGTSAVIDDEYDGAIGFTTITSRIKDTSVIIPEYLCNYLNSDLCKQQIVTMTISDRNNLNQNSFERIVIPVPDILTQKSIVKTLDRFDKLCNDISEGLPAEIEARQKQYEYYRDKLLTFTMKE